MAERSAAKPADAVEPRVLLHVVAGTESVERMCELSNGSVVTPGQIVPLLRWADVARVIFDGPSRVLDVGVRQRVFGGATRVAVERRDQRCQHPSCDVPAERCEIDHVVPFDEGGLTVQANGRCYCPSTTAGTTDEASRPPDPGAGTAAPPLPLRATILQWQRPRRARPSTRRRGSSTCPIFHPADLAAWRAWLAATTTRPRRVGGLVAEGQRP